MAPHLVLTTNRFPDDILLISLKFGATHADVPHLELKTNKNVRFDLGPSDEITQEKIRKIGGKMISWLRENNISAASIDVDPLMKIEKGNLRESFFQGMLLGAFRFDKYTTNNKGPIQIVIVSKVDPTELESDIERAGTLADAQNLAREWSHEPPNIINPVSLAVRAQELADELKLRCVIFDDNKLSKIGANAIVAVGKASETPSRLIILEYPGQNAVKDEPPVVLVGKAITFDSGGYTIKSRAGMLGMKYDKCGGMAVIGIMKAVAKLKLTTPVIGVIAAAENMISGEAYRPNDIVKTLSGKTVEIISADAEGRMVLADALTYAERTYKPRAMIDLATLTGGVKTALGSVRAGLMSNDDHLAEELFNAGERTHERLWRLPLDEDYFELIKGDDSDLKNSGGSTASPITGGKFLQQFISDDTPWAHIDIAATDTVDTNQAYCPKGATGFGVRLLTSYLESLDN